MEKNELSTKIVVFCCFILLIHLELKWKTEKKEKTESFNNKIGILLIFGPKNNNLNKNLS